MTSPAHAKNTGLSFRFGTGQDPPVPTKATAIKHSPIVPSKQKKKSEIKITAHHVKITTKKQAGGSVQVATAVKQVKTTTHKVKTITTTTTKRAPPKRGKSLKTLQLRQQQKQKDQKQQQLQRPRAKWTGMEDDRMIRVLEKLHGKNFRSSATKANWAEVANKMKTGRNAKQCRDRWMNYLRPGLKKGGWEPHEEDQIKEMYHTFGAKWCAMAKMLPHRAENDIKNKWYSMMRKQQRCEQRMTAELNSWSNQEGSEESVEAREPAPSQEQEVVQPRVHTRGKDLKKLVACQMV